MTSSSYAASRLRSKAWSFGSPELSSVLASSVSETILEDLAGVIGVDPDAPAFKFYGALADLMSSCVRVCGSCGAVVEELDASFCGQCGSPLCGD